MYVQERDCWIIWLSDSDEGIPSLLSGRYFYTCLANIPLWFCVCPCHGNWFGLDLSLLALQFISITAHHYFSYLLNPPPRPPPRGGSEGKASACDAGDSGSIPGSGRSPGEGNGSPFPVFLPGESHGQRSLVGYSPQGCKESDMTQRLHFISLSFLSTLKAGNS